VGGSQVLAVRAASGEGEGGEMVDLPAEYFTVGSGDSPT